MNELTYLVVGRDAYLRSEEEATGKFIRILFQQTQNGFFRIGKASLPVKDGCAVLQTAILADGVYEPRLVTETGEYLCAPLEKQGDLLAPAAPSAARLNALFLRLARLEESQENLKKECRRLKAAVYQTQIL